MSEKNRHGLLRNMPADVALAVRRRCGFGCIICGSGLVDYEHLNPEFKDATSHEADNIVLLCPLHHRAKGGFLSRESLVKAQADPWCKRAGFARTELELENAEIHIGSVVAFESNVILSVEHSPLIWFDPADEPGGPARLSLKVRAEDGSVLVDIDKNIWHGSAAAHDIKLVSGNLSGSIRIDVKDGTVFRAEITPPRLLSIKVYRGWFEQNFIELVEDNVGVGRLTVNGYQYPFLLSGNICRGAKSVINII